MAPKVSLVSLQALRSLPRQPACRGGCPVDRQTPSGTEAQVLAVTSSQGVCVGDRWEGVGEDTGKQGQWIQHWKGREKGICVLREVNKDFSEPVTVMELRHEKWLHINWVMEDGGRGLSGRNSMHRAPTMGGSGQHVSHWEGAVAAAGYEMLLQKQAGSPSHRHLQAY